MTSTSASGVVVVGETLIDRVVRYDGTVTAVPGGSPANVAITLGRLGRHPTLVTTFGEDAAGDQVRSWLTASGVTMLNASAPGVPTPTATVVLDDSGSARYEFDIRWEPQPVPEISAALLHIGSIGALLHPGSETVLRMVESARERSTISYDPNIRPALLHNHPAAVERVEALVRLSDVVKASDEDLRWLYPDRPVDVSARAWLGFGPSIVAVTEGEQGVFALTVGGRIDARAPTVVVADTVGAGDTFMGTLIDGLLTAGLAGPANRSALRGIDADAVRELLGRSAAAAAITVSRVGANPPTAVELKAAAEGMRW